MEREILFRGIDAHYNLENGHSENVWRLGNLVSCENGDFCIKSNPKAYGYGSLTDKVISTSIGQFTGVYDKNGTKIFDGDIIKGKRPYGEFWIVKWDKKRCGFFLSGLRKCDFAAYDKGYKINSGRNEVIGNIHDNKELLK